MSESCGTCRFFFRQEEVCRRYPPPNRQGSFPVMGWDDWCGEYDSRECSDSVYVLDHEDLEKLWNSAHGYTATEMGGGPWVYEEESERGISARAQQTIDIERALGNPPPGEV